MHRKNAHEDQRAIQVFIVFLDKVAVVIVGCTMKLIVELDGGVASRPEGGLKEGWECLKHSFLQAETIGRGAIRMGRRRKERFTRRTLSGRFLSHPLQATRRCGSYGEGGESK